VKEFLRKRGACPVVLQTPYGIVNSPFVAVGKNHKLSDGDVISGKVGHDRIQQASGDKSIGEAIRHWYKIKAGCDFERIDVDVSIHPDEHFILIPTAVTLRNTKRKQPLEKVAAPLSFHHDCQSKFWRHQIDAAREDSSCDVAWAASQIRRVVSEHTAAAKGILESDLLRTAGALSILGLDLGPYLATGYDCPNSRFCFAGLPVYKCPVEIKTRSKGFVYQTKQYKKLPRAVVLCMKHNFVNPPEHIDFIDLPVLAEYLDS
jgi:hypothetical protein